MTDGQGQWYGRSLTKNTRLGQKFQFCAEHVNLYERSQKFEKNFTIAATKNFGEKKSVERDDHWARPSGKAEA